MKTTNANDAIKAREEQVTPDCWGIVNNCVKEAREIEKAHPSGIARFIREVIEERQYHVHLDHVYKENEIQAIAKSATSWLEKLKAYVSTGDKSRVKTVCLETEYHGLINSRYEISCLARETSADGEEREYDGLYASFDFGYLRDDDDVTEEIIHDHLERDMTDAIRAFEYEHDVKVTNAAELVEQVAGHMENEFQNIISARDDARDDDDEEEE
jgi:hypothetical protein